MKDKPTMWSGGEFPSNGLETRITKAYDYVKDKPHLRVWLDTESMEPEIWTKDRYDQFMELLKPRNFADSEIKGQVLIFGTGGAIKGDNMKDWHK